MVILLFQQGLLSIVQPIAPTTAEQRLARKNELKAHSTLFMALPDKHQLKFNIHKDAKTLMEAIEKRFGGNKETKKKLISQLEILGESLSQEDINLKFLRSLPTEWRTHTFIWRNKTDLKEQSLDDLFNSLKIYDAEVKISVVAGVSAASAKVPVSALPSVDTLSNAIIYSFFASQSNSPQLDNDDLKQIDRTGRNLRANGTTSMGFDMSKVECYNCHRKRHFTRECSVMGWEAMTGAFRKKKNQSNMPSWLSPPQVLPVLIMRKSQFDVISYKTGLESVEARLLVYQQNETVFEKDTKLLKLNVQLRDNALVVLRQKFKKEEQERDELKLKLEKFQTSSKNLSQLLTSQTNDKTILSYDNHVFTSSMFDCNEMFSSKSDVSMHASPVYDSSNTCKEPCTKGKSSALFQNVTSKPQRHAVPTAVLTKSKLVPLTTVRPVTTAVPQPHVTRPRPAKIVVTKPYSPPRDINRRPFSKPSNFPPKVTTVKTPKGNPQHALMDKGVIYSGCSRHMTWNMSYLSDFEEINGGYVAFGGNPNGGKITGKDTECIVLSPEFKLPDENQVLLRVPKENNMYNMNLKNIVPSRDLTCLFTKATLDESNLWHRQLGYINFKTMNKLVKGNGPTWLFDIDTLTKSMNYQPVAAGNQSNPSVDVQEQFDAEKAGEDNEPEFEGKTPESEVHVSSTNSAKTKNHNDKTTKEAKGKSHVELSSGYRNLSAEFEDFSNNSINEVNDVGTLVFAVGQILTNSTNTFSVVALEYITYSDDEEDVGAEADFSNLEPTITVRPILTTKVHKDHPVTQIIGDLSSATQTRSMIRVVKDQGGLTQINNKDFHTFRNKARLVAQGHTQEEGINYEEVFTPVTRIESIRLFLAYASFMGFMVYQMDVKYTFLYGTIEEEVYVYQPLGFKDPNYLDKDYKVVNALYGLHQALRAWYETLANYLLENGFQRGKIDQTLFIKKQIVKQKQDGIFISHDKYVAEILRKFGLTDGKSASTPVDTEKPLLKDPDGEDVDTHIYRSMIGSLMYLTSLRPDIMFSVCACARFQVTPKVSHLHGVKRIFRYLKGKPHLGLWYPKDSSFNLVAYSDSDYAGASLDRKSTTGGCQFLGCRLISCPDQMVSGKDSSNPLMADNLPKIVWYSTHHVALIKSWLVQMKTALGQMATGKENSNPFMAGSLPKTMLLTENKVSAVIEIKKKVIITKVTVREALQLNDAESIDCLPNEEIFTELSRMGYEKPSTKLTFYKAFFSPSSIALAVICLSTELPSTSQVIPTPPPSPTAQPSSPPQQQQPSQPTHDAEISMDLLQTLLETCTALTRRVKNLEQDKIAQALEIIKLKQKVKRL
nr:hypothetical protein [Tanacetum cinerariifolium]